MTLHENEIPSDEIVVGQLLRAQRPDVAALPVTFVGGGTDNTMYRLGDDYLVRLPRTLDKAGLLAKELTWLPRLAPMLPCQVPEPVHVGRSEPVFPLPWAIYRWIDGDEPDELTVSDWAGYGRELAEFVRRLHSTALLGARRAGELDGYRGGLLQPHDEWITRCFTDARSHGADLDLDTLERLWREALDLPGPTAPHVWLHGDLKPSNVLVRAERLHAVLDFGGLSIGFPDAEHAVTWDLPATARDAYRSVLEIDDLTWARARAWAIAVGISGVAYYWRTYPAFLAECLRRLQAITDDLGQDELSGSLHPTVEAITERGQLG